jgi:hypothetical protein
MDNQIPEDPYRILARERSHEDARQTVAPIETGEYGTKGPETIKNNRQKSRRLTRARSFEGQKTKNPISFFRADWVLRFD